MIKSHEKVHHLASTTFTLDKRFCDLKAIGKGSYGVVCKAFNSFTKTPVAIKKITPVARSSDDAKHVLREVRLMRHLGKHEHIVSLVSLSLREDADELYIIMELLDSDLHRVLQSTQELTENHYRYFMYQLLCGIKYMHMNRVIHRDLKPGNLLISKDCKLRITDFGLARERPTGTHSSDIEKGISSPMTEHVVTRWYRAPELMLCPDGFYDYSVDIWSAGCILGEMLGRKPLFPGKNFVHQLSLIFDVIGVPSYAEVAHIKNSQAKKFLASQKDKAKVPFSHVYPSASTAAHSLLEKVLVFVPDRRFNVDKCLSSSFVADMNYPSTSYPPISADFEFSFERRKDVNTSQLLRLVRSESKKIRNEAKRKDLELIAKLPLHEQSMILEELAKIEDSESEEETSKREESRKKVTGSRSDRERSEKHANETTKTSRYVSVKPPVPKLSTNTAVQDAPVVISARSHSTSNIGTAGTKRAVSAPRERPPNPPMNSRAAKNATGTTKTGMKRQTSTTNNPFSTSNSAKKISSQQQAPGKKTSSGKSELPVSARRTEATRDIPPQQPVPQKLYGTGSGDIYSGVTSVTRKLDDDRNKYQYRETESESESEFESDHNLERRNVGPPDMLFSPKRGPNLNSARDLTTANRAEAIRDLENSDVIRRATNVLSPHRKDKSLGIGASDRAPAGDRVPPGGLWDRENNYSERTEFRKAVSENVATVTENEVDEYLSGVLEMSAKVAGGSSRGVLGNDLDEDDSDRVHTTGSGNGKVRPASAYMYNRADYSSGAVRGNAVESDDSVVQADDSDSEDEAPVMPTTAVNHVSSYYESMSKAAGRPVSAGVTRGQRQSSTAALQRNAPEPSDTDDDSTPVPNSEMLARIYRQESSQRDAGYQTHGREAAVRPSENSGQARAHHNGRPHQSRPSEHVAANEIPVKQEAERNYQRDTINRAAKQVKKKKLTVPKSPKFSTMSYQRANSANKQVAPPHIPVSLTQMNVDTAMQRDEKKYKQAAMAPGNYGGLYDDDRTVSDDEPDHVVGVQKGMSSRRPSGSHSSYGVHGVQQKAVSNATAKAVAEYLLNHQPVRTESNTAGHGRSTNRGAVYAAEGEYRGTSTRRQEWGQSSSRPRSARFGTTR